MTDLTTAHLRHLLAQSTPGPWEYEGPQFQEITTQDHNGLEQSVISLDRYTEKDFCNRPSDMNLAAAAPALAQEILWMRREISELRNALVQPAIDCATMDNSEGKLAARVAQSAEEQLFRILLERGDHNE